MPPRPPVKKLPDPILKTSDPSSPPTRPLTCVLDRLIHLRGNWMKYPLLGSFSPLRAGSSVLSFPSSQSTHTSLIARRILEQFRMTLYLKRGTTCLVLHTIVYTHYTHYTHIIHTYIHTIYMYIHYTHIIHYTIHTLYTHYTLYTH